MKKTVLYPVVPRVRQVNIGKKRTLPNQAMSLREMLKRFIRREALPVERKGVYIETEYDLEKIPHLDRTEQDEILTEMKAKTAKAKEKLDKRQKEDQEKAIAAEIEKQKAEDAKKQSDPKGASPG